MTTVSMESIQTLKAKLGNREAEAIVNYVNNKVKENNHEMQEWNLKILATKEDLANVKGSLETKIAESKSDIIRWIFALFVTMMLAFIGLYLKK